MNTLVSQTDTSIHTGIPVSTYHLMHADELILTAHRNTNSLDIKNHNKLPFGLRNKQLDFIAFDRWLTRRTDNLSRTYMNKVYLARKIGRERENILRDSCAMSVTDQFWVNRSDINMTWGQLQELRDQNETLDYIALTGDTANINYAAASAGTTSLFATKGAFPKTIRGNTMLKQKGTQEREWVATIIGEALNIPVQKAKIISPIEKNNNEDNTLVEIKLFTGENMSLVHAYELFFENSEWQEAIFNGQHHRYFYDRLPNEQAKRDFEKVLILNWLISNHDMHEENYGCLYNPETFEITAIAPSFDHNCADFDGTEPELDVRGIVIPSILHHRDIIRKIKSGKIETAIQIINGWLTDEQKNNILTIGEILVKEYGMALEAENCKNI